MSNNMVYNPPPLPEYISTNYNLNVIVGVPKEEEVKAIHDAIRAVNSVSNFPALYDHKLSTQLAQYLFTVQMGGFDYISERISIQHLSSGHRFGQIGCYDSYHTVNEKGELPWMYCFGDIYARDQFTLSRSIPEKELVAYLNFYNIGTELIEEGTENIKPGKEEDAKKSLAYFLYNLRPLEM
ncbi:unnamed protein product [Rhizoctonia solani]|uniref:Uncharacterized protein n=1 Tax=Rhizoctonia solani TaxID=456999 RepID=A0A8H2WG24_9AGAM|nr:unnamed protein product [Rhizoctonia solani]